MTKYRCKNGHEFPEEECNTFHNGWEGCETFKYCPICHREFFLQFGMEEVKEENNSCNACKLYDPHNMVERVHTCKEKPQLKLEMGDKVIVRDVKGTIVSNPCFEPQDDYLWVMPDESFRLPFCAPVNLIKKLEQEKLKLEVGKFYVWENCKIFIFSIIGGIIHFIKWEKGESNGFYWSSHRNDLDIIEEWKE